LSRTVSVLHIKTARLASLKAGNCSPPSPLLGFRVLSLSPDRRQTEPAAPSFVLLVLRLCVFAHLLVCFSRPPSQASLHQHRPIFASPSPRVSHISCVALTSYHSTSFARSCSFGVVASSPQELPSDLLARSLQPAAYITFRHVKNSRVTLVTEPVCCQWYLQLAKARIVSSPVSGFNFPSWSRRSLSESLWTSRLQPNVRALTQDTTVGSRIIPLARSSCFP